VEWNNTKVLQDRINAMNSLKAWTSYFFIGETSVITFGMVAEFGVNILQIQSFILSRQLYLRKALSRRK
jgi:hypothetical protein